MDGKTQRAYFTERAADLGFEFDDGDLALLDEIAQTADDIAELDDALKRDGRTITSKTGNVKTHPALASVRQLRFARNKLAAMLERRIEQFEQEVAAQDKKTAAMAGGNPNPRGLHYIGNGAPNQARDKAADRRRGRGRIARPRAQRGA
ncbi:hypothetical protein CH256_26240 [Rhodococcus sp. 05-2254-6]|uniref:P27 family phage terminase small subunit n=1 Tax=Rhodococcus sp. 05-2254-6 TaxID=2022489 RepID=UPI000B9BBB58|nr:P27 family phage terminase small subunit [Rhodococcus sp. 05-2254-6]OZE18828.1 hypothetical protein CH256_26240 [Rhodococcus sp. 05-2254-6]